MIAPAVALATVIKVPSERELVARADTIALATVLRTDTFVNVGGHAVTQVELQAVRGVKGVADRAFFVAEVPGGPLANGLVAKVEGAPVPRVGDLVFAFLATTAGAGRPIGMRYGWLDVRRDARGDLRASHQLDGLTFVGAPHGAPPPDVLAVDNELIDALIARVQVHMRALALPDPNVGGSAEVRR